VSGPYRESAYQALRSSIPHCKARVESPIVSETQKKKREACLGTIFTPQDFGIPQLEAIIDRLEQSNSNE